MDKIVMDLGSETQLHHLAALIIERTFPKDTDMTVDKLMQEIEDVVKRIVS